MAEIFSKTDSFDPLLFNKLKQVVISELPPQNQAEREIFEVFGQQMLEEIEMLCQCNKIRKHSAGVKENEDQKM